MSNNADPQKQPEYQELANKLAAHFMVDAPKVVCTPMGPGVLGDTNPKTMTIRLNTDEQDADSRLRPTRDVVLHEFTHVLLAHARPEYDGTHGKDFATKLNEVAKYHYSDPKEFSWASESSPASVVLAHDLGYLTDEAWVSSMADVVVAKMLHAGAIKQSDVKRIPMGVLMGWIKAATDMARK
jgi:hypothetical protein